MGPEAAGSLSDRSLRIGQDRLEHFVDRVTVTLPDDLVKEIDRREKNRASSSRRPSATNSIAVGATNFVSRWTIPTPRVPTSPNRDLRSGRAAYPRKMPRHSSTATLAGRFGRSPAKAG